MSQTTLLTVGSLFSGIGGIELGLEQTGGFVTSWQVELDRYCQRILAKHWPHVPKYSDIRDCGAHNLPRVDVLAGGFPCQNISSAGRQEGLAGEQSGLWFSFQRLICELRPRYVLVENVAALRFVKEEAGEIQPAPMATILGDLALAGYDAEWTSLYAFQFGYPHYRERCFLVAYPNGLGLPRLFGDVPVCERPPRPRLLTKLDWNRHLLEWFEQRVRQPAVFGGNPGIAYRSHRLRALGNSVMPAMSRLVGECILRREALLGTSSSSS